MNNLFENSDSDDNECSLKTENAYAKKYDEWRGKEELHKLTQKYGENPTESGSDDSESDEEPEVPEEVEKQFLKTLSLLKKKDPRIYDPDFKFFQNDEEGKPTKEIKDEVTEKPQKELNSLAAAFAESDESDNEEIFKVEKKIPQPAPKEDVVKGFLTGKVEHIPDEEELAPLKALWSDPKLNEGEAFLRDYILERKYLEEGDIPGDKLLEDETLEVDEEQVEEQGKFERAYNFRFEEPDQEYLKRYPRTLSAARPKDERRARRRADLRARKLRDRSRKMDDIARIKALKLQEIREKIARIKEVTGNEELAFRDEDVEGDFDPEEHDRRMGAIFDEQYYDEADAEKPVFPELDEELEIENWDNYEPEHGGVKENGDEGLHCEDENFNMDADYDPRRARTTLMEEIKETLGKKRRNRKRQSKLAKLLELEKPKYVPLDAGATYAEFMEDYYRMDCEDVIGGDLPTRFKYRDVVPNSFGLTVEEILLADDKDLNQWASLKKTVKYRPEHVEKGEVKTYQQKAMDERLKKKMLPSLFKELPEEPELVVPTETKKKKKKKKNKEQKSDNNNVTTESNPDLVTNDHRQEDSSKTKNKNESKNSEETVTTEDASEKEHHNANSMSKKKQNEVENGTDLAESQQNNAGVSNTENSKKVKNKKRKQSEFIVEDISPKAAQADRQSIGTNNTPKMAEGYRKKNNKLKRKLYETNNTEANNKHPTKKKKRQNNESFENTKKNKNSNHNGGFKKRHDTNKDDNPLGKLSDGRLKAYGLNPKKYRSFLKYKKF